MTKIQDHVVTQASGGYAICDIFKFPSGLQVMPVVKGTPRMIGAQTTKTNQENRIGKTVLSFQFVKYAPLAALRDLVPMNCLVNIRNVIPGLDTADNKFPKPRVSLQAELSSIPLKILPKRPIYLTNI